MGIVYTLLTYAHGDPHGLRMGRGPAVRALPCFPHVVFCQGLNVVQHQRVQDREEIRHPAAWVCSRVQARVHVSVRARARARSSSRMHARARVLARVCGSSVVRGCL